MCTVDVDVHRWRWQKTDPEDRLEMADIMDSMCNSSFVKRKTAAQILDVLQGKTPPGDLGARRLGTWRRLGRRRLGRRRLGRRRLGRRRLGPRLG